MIQNSSWYAVFRREMMLYRKKLLKKGHVFAALITPLIYLLAFGLGLGRRVQMENGNYLDYLLPGLVAMSSMSNSYNWLATSFNLAINYFRTFQVMFLAPVSAASIAAGEVLAGMVKGMFSSGLIIGTGYLLSDAFRPGGLFFLVWLLNAFLFASLGLIVAMKARTHEETGAYSNLLVMPMTFFSGTFFPLDHVPFFFKAVIYLLPLTHTNILIRKQVFDAEALVSLLVLLLFSAVFFFLAVRLIRRYSE